VLRELDPQSGVDLGQPLGEDSVDDDALDLDDFADVLILAAWSGMGLLERRFVTCPGRGETACPGFGVYRSAAALDPAWDTPFRPLSSRPPASWSRLQTYDADE
jgi:hypothetical protein